MSNDKRADKVLAMARDLSFEDELAMVKTDAGLERRMAERHATTYNAACRLGTISYNIEVCDVSSTGLRAKIRRGLVPRLKQNVSIQLMNGYVIEGVCVWVRKSEIGIEFLKPEPSLSEGANFDELGAEFYRLVLKFQIFKD